MARCSVSTGKPASAAGVCHPGATGFAGCAAGTRSDTRGGATRCSGFCAVTQIPGAYGRCAAAVLVTAYYDVARARLLYARNLPEDVNDGVVLAAANAGQAWFYHPGHATVWRVDAITGTVKHRYRLMNPALGARIIGCEQTANGLRLRQKMLEVNGGVEIAFEYLLTEYSAVLTGIHTSAAWSDYTPRRPADYWHSLVARFKTPRTYADGTSGMASSLSTWGPAGFVQIHSHEKETLRDLGWIRLADRLYFQLAHSTGLKLDTILLTWDDGVDDLPLFYSKQARMLRRGAGPVGGQVVAEMSSMSVHSLSATSQPGQTDACLRSTSKARCNSLASAPTGCAAMPTGSAHYRRWPMLIGMRRFRSSG